MKKDIKIKYLTRSGVENFMDMGDDATANYVAGAFVETLRDRIEKVRGADTQFKAYVQEEKKKKKRVKNVDSDLRDFMV